MNSVGNVEKTSLWAPSSCQSAPSSPSLAIRAPQGKAGAKSTARLEGQGHFFISYFEEPNICLSAQCADWTNQNGRRQSQQTRETINKNKNSERFLRQTSTKYPELWARPSPRKGGGEGWGSQEGRAHQLRLLLQVEGSCQPLSWNHIMCRLPSTVLITHRRMP